MLRFSLVIALLATALALAAPPTALAIFAGNKAYWTVSDDNGDDVELRSYDLSTGATGSTYRAPTGWEIQSVDEGGSSIGIELDRTAALGGPTDRIVRIDAFDLSVSEWISVRDSSKRDCGTNISGWSVNSEGRLIVLAVSRLRAKCGHDLTQYGGKDRDVLDVQALGSDGTRQLLAHRDLATKGESAWDRFLPDFGPPAVFLENGYLVRSSRPGFVSTRLATGKSTRRKPRSQQEGWDPDLSVGIDGRAIVSWGVHNSDGGSTDLLFPAGRFDSPRRLKFGSKRRRPAGAFFCGARVAGFTIDRRDQPRVVLGDSRGRNMTTFTETPLFGSVACDATRMLLGDFYADDDGPDFTVKPIG